MGISITESLTAKRMEQLKKVREGHRFTSVQTTDGRIPFKHPNEIKSFMLQLEIIVVFLRYT